MAQLVLQPDGAAGKDTYIDSEEPTTAHDGVDLRVGLQLKAVNCYRALIHWDISSIPPGSTIQSTSKLDIYLSAVVGSPTARIRRQNTTTWTESATWNKYDGSTVWGSLSGISSSAATDLFTKTGHGLLVGQRVRFTALDGMTGVNTVSNYYVISSGLTANDFKISISEEGTPTDVLTGTSGSAAALDLTGGTCTTPDVPFTFPGAGGAFSITGADMAAFLQDALNSRSGNAEMLIKVDDEATTSNQEIASSDNGTAANRPKLTVDYTLPVGGHRMMFGG